MALSKPFATAESLLRSCEKGEFDTAQEILSLGIDPRITDRNGWSAVHWGCWHGDAAFVKALIERYNCKEDQRTTNTVYEYGWWFVAGIAPLHLACW